MSQTTATITPPRPTSLRVRSFDPLIILWILLALALIFLVVNPLFRLVQSSMEEVDTGAFTLMNYYTAFSRPRYITALWNSLRLGANKMPMTRLRTPIGRGRAPSEEAAAAIRSRIFGGHPLTRRPNLTPAGRSSPHLHSGSQRIQKLLLERRELSCGHKVAKPRPRKLRLQHSAKSPGWA